MQHLGLITIGRKQIQVNYCRVTKYTGFTKSKKQYNKDNRTGQAMISIQDIAQLKKKTKELSFSILPRVVHVLLQSTT